MVLKCLKVDSFKPAETLIYLTPAFNFGFVKTLESLED